MNISIENFLNNFLHVEYSKTISKYFLTMCLPFLILISCKTKETVTTLRKNTSPEKIISWQNENNKNLEKTKKSKILRKDGEINLLENAYRNSFQLAETLQLKTMAFPNISTGIYRFPKQLAAEIALKTIQAELNQGHWVQEVTFVCFDDENFNLYQLLKADF